MRFCTACGTPLPTPAFAPSTVPVDSPPPTDADLESDSESSVREAAAERIIAAVDIDAMHTCARRALARGDLERAEFWLIEIATADADDAVRADGVEELCEAILIPQWRFEEAELYCQWAATVDHEASDTRAQATLDRIRRQRSALGRVRLEHNGQWRDVDLTQPAVIGQSQRDHYLRLLAFLNYRDEQGGFAELRQGVVDDFMPTVTGYLLGFMDPAAKTGIARETAAKAIADWIDTWRDPA